MGFGIINTGSAATMAAGVGAYIAPIAHFTIIRQKVVQVVVITLFTTINCFSVTLGKWIQNTLSFIQLGGLLLLIAILLVHAYPGNLRLHFWPTSPHWELASFGVVLVAVPRAYDGWHTISFVAGEVKNPFRNIPGRLILGILSCVTVYIFANIAYYSVLTPSAVSKSDRVAAALLPPSAAFAPCSASSRQRYNNDGEMPCRRHVSETFPLLMPSCTTCHFSSADRSTRGFLPSSPPFGQALILPRKAVQS